MGHGLSEDEFQTLRNVRVALSVVSLAAALFIMSTYAYFRQLRTFAFTLVFWLAFADAGYAIGGLFGNADSGADCIIQAVVTSFFELASILWTAAMAYTVYAAFTESSLGARDIQAMLPKFHAGVWGFSLLMTILPFSTESYGDAGGWCWIRNDTDKAAGDAWRFLSFYIPLWVVIGWNSYVYFATRRKVAALHDAAASPSGSEKQPQRLKRIMYYPIALVAIFFFATINRIHQLFADPDLTLTTLHLIGASLSGAVNASLYGFTPSVQTAIRERLCQGGHAEIPDDENDVKIGDAPRHGDDEEEVEAEEDEDGHQHDGVAIEMQETRV